jgi:hypothetical protein
MIATGRALGLTLLLMVVPAYCQVLSVGVKAGVPLTDAYTDVFASNGAESSSEQRFIVGPTAEVHLPFHFSVEVDALWRRSSPYQAGVSPDTSSVNDWQIPFLAKYELSFGPVHPFVDGGVVYRHVSDSGSFAAAISNANSSGVSVGWGVTLKFLHFRLAPEVRYTRWPAPPNFQIGGVVSNANQADFLVGFTF